MQMGNLEHYRIIESIKSFGRQVMANFQCELYHPTTRPNDRVGKQPEEVMQQRGAPAKAGVRQAGAARDIP